MKAKDLKNSILQMAVEGKLVPQDPNDEPASVLLERIREEKQRLIAEGKAKFPKGGESIIYTGSDGSPYEKRVDAKGSVLSEKCIADEVPFEELPEGWAWARLETALVNRDSERIPVSVADRERLAKIYDYYGASGVIDKVDRYLFDKTLLLIGEDGANLLMRSKPIAFLARGKYWVNNHAHVLDGINERYLEYIALFINSISLAPYVTGTAQPKMNQAKMGSILIPIPPESEQTRILAKVNELMPLVDDYGKLEDAREALDAALPDRLRKSVLQMAVQGKLVPQDPADEPASVLLERIREQRRKLIAEKKVRAPKGGESVIYTGSDGRRYEKRIDKKGCIVSDKCIENEIPFDIPDGWAWTRLPGIVNIGIGKTPSRHEPEYWLNGTVPWFSISDMNDGETVFKTKEKVSSLACENCFKSELVSAGTLLMSFKLTIGKTSIMGVDGVHNEAIVSIAPYIDKADALRDYLLWVLPLFAKGGNTKSAIKGATLNSKSLAALLIPLPPLAEQQRIVEQIQVLVSLAV